MNKIIFPLTPGMQGAAVVDLQDALQLFMDRSIILANDPVTRVALSVKLRIERTGEVYRDTTRKLVNVFQETRQVPPNGGVDEATAKEINRVLKELGVLDQTGEPAPPRSFIVSGQVRREDNLPLRDMRVRAVHKTEQGSLRLGEDTTNTDGSYTIRYESLPEVDVINLVVSVTDDDGELLQSSKAIPSPKPLQIIEPLIVPITRQPDAQRRIEGQIMLQHGLPAERLRLRLYRHDFGGNATLLEETSTLAGGEYAFAFDPGAAAASLEVRAVKGEDEEIPLSKPLNNLNGDTRANLNLVAPDTLQPLGAEYRRLLADLTTHVGEITRLAGAKENDERQDLTVLNRATGWDARLIALAATTERLSAEADIQLPAESIYGLLRAGLPSDKLMMAQVEPDVAEKALKTVRDAGIVDLTDQQISDFKTQFASFSTRVRLNVPALGARATYGEFLDKSGLSDEAKAAFAPVYLNHRGNGAQLWEEAHEAGLDDAQIGKLQLQGKFAFLAGNSETMTAALMAKQINDPVELVKQDFYRADSWVTEVLTQAGIPLERRNNLTDADKEKLAPIIPAAYVGEKVEDRLESYADDMARKVRIGFPTQVIERQIERNEIVLPADRDSTLTLVKNAAAQGFRLGETPVETFFKTHTGVRDGIADDEFQGAQQQIKTLQRVYQITPTNEAMPVLMALDMTSAFDVMAYSEEEFISLYAGKYFEIYEKFPTPTESRLILRKANQVSSVAYNLFTIARKLDSEPPVAGMSAPVEVRESVRNELIKQFPTMESLFGSMDFCECEHCRTVLSPAAYLVDLLQFVDIEPGVWSNFLAQWIVNHGNQVYPHIDKNGNPLKPYDVLVERRPDLPHIALTCENTHTALPYIDIVNEILEYYVANGKLSEAATHETGEATTAELLAEPQNVISGAYDMLRETRYPLTLPFDLWIETVRQFCNYFETPLARVLEVFRPNDDLFAPVQPFDRSSIFMESLGLSNTDLEIFTEPDPLANDGWHELYGLPTIRPAIQNPTNDRDATLTIDNADARKFQQGLVCTYFDVSTSSLSPESKTITAIGPADSGGPGQTIVIFAGVWSASPNAGDLLVCDAPAMLKSATTLSRRLSVSYKEIAAIVETGFVNPMLSELALLYKLGVSIQDARLYKDHKLFYEQNKDLIGADRGTLSPADQQRFDDLSNTVPNTEKTGWEIVNELAAFDRRLNELAAEFNTTLDQLQTQIQNIAFDRVLVLADPDAGCNFDLTTLQYADGTKADPIVFLRFNLFVRLWRKLGWSLEETDRVLQAFVPKNTRFETANLAQQPLKTTLIYVSHLKELNYRLGLGKQGRMKLITLWTDIATTGKKPLYAQLFLTRNVLKSDAVFDHPLGEYLSNGEKIKNHVLALQSALGLTTDDISRILVDAEISLDTTDLTLPNVSLLYRYGLLAKALKLSTRDLISLKQLSGLDPFRQLHPEPLADTPATKAIELDHPFTQTIRFIEVAAEVKGSGLKIEDLDYLLRHQFDGTGKYRSDPDATLALLKTLAEGIRAIRAEHAVSAAGGMGEEVLRQKLGLVLPPDVVARFLAMTNGTIEFTATTVGLDPADKLEPVTFAGEKQIRQLSYKEVPHQEQKLTFRGVLFEDQKTELQTNFDAQLTPPQRVAFAALLGGVKTLAREFFDNHLKQQKLRLEAEAGFLEDGDFTSLFRPLTPLLEILSTDTEAQVAAKLTENERIQRENLTELQARRDRIAQAFLPFLQQRLIQQFIVQTMTAYTGAEPAIVESLLTDERLLAGPQPLLDALAAIGERGVSADFFDSVDGSGPRQPTSPSGMDVDTAVKANKDTNGNPLNPANSARFEGYLEVPSPGAYRFYVVLDKQNAEALLRFDHLPNPEFLSGAAAADNAVLGDQADEFLELNPGIPYRFSLDLKKLNGGDARLLVQGETLPKGSVSQFRLYPFTAVQEAESAVLLLTKVLQLVQSLGLNEREIRYLLTHAAAFDGLSLRQLPTRSSDDTSDSARVLFRHFLRLAGYARLKLDLAGGADDLIGIFEANETTGANRLDKVYSLIAGLTRRDEATVTATAEVFAADPQFESEKPIEQLWQALQIVERFGVPVKSLLEWTRIVSSTSTPDERTKIAIDVKEAIKARFEPETWQRVAKAIFDKLRPRQRDALAAHVMHQHGFERMEQLYEYFLIDPGMEAVVQTSRVRLAIASLQLFIQRCLLNMELQVHPSAINSKQWEWMKRYRVWEANRKIFLFPENWLEPEFRDDKTHLFAELEGALLQGDVSSDLVEDAFLNYLQKLDELARLDIVAMHLEDNPDPARRTLHVIGRTHSQPHKYFYRRYAHQMWTPWEPVTAEIEGHHLAPVVWRDRLYLFWVTFMDKPDTNGQPGAKTNGQSLTNAFVSDLVSDAKAAGAKKQIDVQLHWCEYLQGEWTAAESGEFFPVMTLNAGSGGPNPVANTTPGVVSSGDSVGISSRPPLTVPMNFDPRSVFIHVAKEPYENGEERGVFVQLKGPANFQHAFFLAGRNSAPQPVSYNSNPLNPYSASTPRATRYSGTGGLKVSFQERITTEPGKTPPKANPSILQQGRGFTLLPCDNNITSLGISEDAFNNAANSEAVKAALERGVGEIEALMKPVFYQDDAHTMFVEPNVTERTIEEWQDWVTRTPQPDPEWHRPDWWKDIVVIPEKPRKALIPNEDPRGGFHVDPGSLINPKTDFDWLLNPGTALQFDGVLIGPTGRPGLRILASENVTEVGPLVKVNPGSGIASGSSVVFSDSTKLEENGLMEIAGGLNIVGGSGFNATLEKNFTEANRSSFGPGLSSNGRSRR
jgi:hypothetical protein